MVPEIPSVIPLVLDLGHPFSQQPVLEQSVKSTSLEDLLNITMSRDRFQFFSFKTNVLTPFWESFCFQKETISIRSKTEN